MTERPTTGVPELDAIVARGRAHESPPEDPAVAARRARRKAIVERWGFGLPERTQKLVVEDRLYSTRPLEMAKAWVQGPREVLVEVGDPGTGKSVACSWAALEREHEGPIVYLLESTLAEWRARPSSHERELLELHEAGTVVVDELARTEHRHRELARVAIGELVGQRLGAIHVPGLGGGARRRRRTILQGNLELDELADFRTCK